MMEERWGDLGDGGGMNNGVSVGQGLVNQIRG